KRFADEGELGGFTIKVSRAKVGCLALLKAHSVSPGLESRPKLVIGLNRTGFLNRLSDGLGEFEHPLLARFLKGAPQGVMPIDDARRLLMVLAAEAGLAMRAVTDAGPEGHVEEDSLEVVVLHQLAQAGEGMLAIGRVGAHLPHAAEHDGVIAVL